MCGTKTRREWSGEFVVLLHRTQTANMVQAMIAAKIVWAFDISLSSPADSSIETGYTDGFVVGPKRYPAKFTPRTQERASIIAKEAQNAESFLSRFD